MAYELGIDLGTTYTAAAIRRQSAGRRADAEVVELGTRSAVVASVLFLAPDGSVLVGEAAQRRALTDPARVAREFKRRIGDDTPMIVGGMPYAAHGLAARLVRWVVDRVAQQEGGPAGLIAVTHPACWGPHTRALLGGALSAVGLPRVMFLPEPPAAAINYARTERVERGSTIAVYDLGGGTFDAAVVRKTAAGGFELLGTPVGIERLGGVNFDEAVFSHVRTGLGGAIEALDTSDPDVITAVSRLRRECTEAKETLSADTEVTIPVLLPDLRTQIRLHRAEFEDLIRPAIQATVDALRSALGSAGVRSADLSAVLLVGGSARIPLVAQLVSEGLRRPVTVDADPKLAIALGAVSAFSPVQAAWTLPATLPEMPVQEPAPPTSASSSPPPRPLVSARRETGRGAGRGNRRVQPKLVVGAAGVVLAAALVGFFAIQQVRPSSGPPESPSVTPTFVAPPESRQPRPTANPAPGGVAEPARRQPPPPARPTRDRTGPTTTEPTSRTELSTTELSRTMPSTTMPTRTAPTRTPPSTTAPSTTAPTSTTVRTTSQEEPPQNSEDGPPQGPEGGRRADRAPQDHAGGG